MNAGLGHRMRAATATLALAQCGLNPGQRRGPDGRWIKMGGPGSAGGKRKDKSGKRSAAPRQQPRPGVDVPAVGGRADLTERNVELDSGDRQFLSDYIEDGGTYRAVNSALRGQVEMTPEMAAKIERLDAITANAKLGGNTTLYRAMSGGQGLVGALLDARRTGQLFTDPGFGSATGDREAARDFEGVGSTAVVLEISAEKGQPVLVLGDDLSDTAMMQTPQEVLLPRGYQLEIDRVNMAKVDGVQVWTAKAIYRGARPTPIGEANDE